MRRNKNGFTLVEVIVSVAIMAVILIPVLSVFITNSRGIITARENSNVQAEAQQLMTSLKNNCLYTKNVESCKVNGSECKDDKNYSIPDNTPYTIIVRQPTKASPGYKDITYQYKTDNGGEFYIDDVLITKGAKVKMTPIYPDSVAANQTFANAIGVNVDISLSTTHPGTKKTSKIDNLSNAFYFRNNGDMQFMSYGAPVDGVDDPTPYPTVNNSGGGTGGGGGGSETSAPSSSPTTNPTSNPTPNPTTPAPTPTPTPWIPTPTPTAKPTPTPTTPAPTTPAPTQNPPAGGVTVGFVTAENGFIHTGENKIGVEAMSYNADGSVTINIVGNSGWSTEKITIAKNGDSYALTGENGGWWILSNSGKFGWNDQYGCTLNNDQINYLRSEYGIVLN